MLKYLAIVLTAVAVSLFYFPFEFSFLPGINTKMMLAVMGIGIAAYRLIQNRTSGIPKGIAKIVLLSGVVSLMGLFSVIVNNTPDYAYSTYFISMAVWLSGAFTVCTLIKTVHGRLTVERISMYLVIVCAFQCIMALVIDSSIEIKAFIDRYVMQDQERLTKLDRLYGIGAWLDVAGVRFSAAMIMLVYVVNRHKALMSNFQIFLSVSLYVLIAVVGNMIARTAIVGVGLSIAYLLLTFRPDNVSRSSFRVARILLLIVAVAVPMGIYSYNHNPQFQELFRFAFEGFFSLFEEGVWQTDSTDRLQTMIVFPDNVKTWIMGDGYFINPYDTDPYYVGEFIGGYYMGTDIGYLRFIFYFGLIGLIAFSYFFIAVARECIKIMPEHKTLILFILLLGFIIWLKVATDVFLVFALLLCASYMKDEETSQIESEL